MEDKDETIRRLAFALAPFARAASQGYVLYDAVKTTVDNDEYKSQLAAEPIYAAMYKTQSYLSWSNFLTLMDLMNDRPDILELMEEWQRD